MSISRRALLQAGLCVGLLQVLPKTNWLTKRLSFVQEANAHWLAIAQLALSAASLFVRSNNGLGAMLSNVRELQMETVRLLQDVTVQLGRIEGSLINMPKIIRKQLSMHAEYKVVEETDNIRKKLEFCERQQKEGHPQKDILREIVRKSTDLARFSSVPYGIGGRAALCAPLVAAIDARARQLLGKPHEIRDAVAVFYLPWIREIQSMSDGALFHAFVEAGRDLQEEIAKLEETMPPLVKQHLGATFVLNALKLDPGAPSLEAAATCGYYDSLIRYNQGKCIDNDYSSCHVNPSNIFPESHILVPPESLVEQGLVLDRDIEPRDRICSGRCVAWENIPVFQTQSSIRGIVTAKNDFHVPQAQNTEEIQGPILMLTTKWEKGNAPPQNGCTRYLVGTNSGDQQIVDLQSSSQAKEWEKQFSAFVQGPIENINNNRQAIYAMYQLLLSVKEAENLLERVTT
ncbi:MAG: hypothetical protein WBO24_17765 [Nitrospirales bacterium]